jgi:hypothetical protein
LSIIIVEMRLLLNGLLDDPEIFESLGYERLFEDGYLTFDVWERFQKIRVNQTIDRLENALSQCMEEGMGNNDDMDDISSESSPAQFRDLPQFMPASKNVSISETFQSPELQPLFAEPHPGIPVNLAAHRKNCLLRETVRYSSPIGAGIIRSEVSGHNLADAIEDEDSQTVEFLLRQGGFPTRLHLSQAISTGNYHIVAFYLKMEPMSMPSTKTALR